jgi:hypothetical protein
MTSNLQDLPSHLAGLRNVKYHYWTDRRLLSTPTRCDKGDDMGGVVSEIGDIGQGIISGVNEGLTDLDDSLPQEAKIAAAIYLASQGIPVEGAALSGAGATEAALTATDLAIGGGSLAGAAPTIGATEAALAATDLAIGGGGGAVNAGFTLPAIPPEVSAVSNANSVVNAANMTPQQTLEMIAKEQAASKGLIGGAMDWASANAPLALAGAGLAAKALGGSTPSSSTATTSIDPDVKAAYLRNLEEARATAAGLGTRQFAPMSEYNLGMVQRYMNPYEQQVIQGTLGDIERARQGQISAEGARATAAKAFGGTRQAVTRSLVDEAALRNAGNLAAQLRQGGFTQAQNLGLSQEDLRRQLEQQRLDAARGLGVERLNVAQGALSLQPARIGESTTKPIYTNPVASGFGGALGGAQLGSLIGGKESGSEYAAYGAGLGGLLGFLG